MHGLWVLDLATGRERLVADPRVLDDRLPSAEQGDACGTGVAAFSTDRAVTVAAFALGGRLFVADLRTAEVRSLPVPEGVADPRLDPAGEHVAYVADGALRVIGTSGRGDRLLAASDVAGTTWGSAEFAVAEEMGRDRGFWWSPDGSELLVASVDTRAVPKWYLAEPADPARPPAPIPYPAAGTANATVRLWRVGLTGARTEVPWDRGRFPYLTAVRWSPHGPPLAQVQTRDQRTVRVLALGAEVATVHEERDAHWVTLVPGTPAWTRGGELVRVAVRQGAYRLVIGTDVVTPPGLQVRAVVDVDDDVVFTGSEADPTQVHVYRASATTGVERISDAAGVHDVARGGDVLVVTSRTLSGTTPSVRVLAGKAAVGSVRVRSELPVAVPRVRLLVAGARELRCALLLPREHVAGSRALPVLLDPYGGPAAQRVRSALDGYLFSQWFADQGFAVLIADGRGTPGRGPEWDRSIRFDEARINVEDQVEALEAVAARHPDLDLTRVAIRGWSHGGYLALLAVLRRPDVFHAAVAGAPVTDRRLYNTHYTERYLGHPAENPEVYERNSVLPAAAELRRPLLVIHGLADDNVVFAHSAKLSDALVAAARPHTLLPLSAAAHRPPHGTAAQLMRLQAAFLKESLGMPGTPEEERTTWTSPTTKPSPSTRGTAGT
ncbi:prolyl oligopeptidase family serine peptidase [Amycolatopsis sp. cmx-4-83]|uniref:S9 family peptidase n=1 Tax=Amycolatopsis sp. cmx-4-83 TaxID=2790940 RepID=UPI003978CB05